MNRRDILRTLATGTAAACAAVLVGPPRIAGPEIDPAWLRKARALRAMVASAACKAGLAKVWTDPQRITAAERAVRVADQLCRAATHVNRIMCGEEDAEILAWFGRAP